MRLWTNQSGNDAVTVGFKTSRTLFNRGPNRGRERGDGKCVQYNWLQRDSDQVEMPWRWLVEWPSTLVKTWLYHYLTWSSKILHFECQKHTAVHRTWANNLGAHQSSHRPDWSGRCFEQQKALVLCEFRQHNQKIYRKHNKYGARSSPWLDIGALHLFCFNDTQRTIDIQRQVIALKSGERPG